MTIEATIQTLLGALVGGRCFPLINTNSVIVTPYITFQVITDIPELSLDGPERSHVRMQIDVWETTYGAAKTLAESVKTALFGASFVNVPLMFQDLYEEVSKEYRVLLEYSIWP